MFSVGCLSASAGGKSLLQMLWPQKQSGLDSNITSTRNYNFPRHHHQITTKEQIFPVVRWMEP